jgi:hypothetical protein
MKFTSEDLMKAMGLSVGDKVKIGKLAYIIDFDCVLRGIGHNEDLDCYGIHMLVGTEYEILPKPKRVGDLKCDDFECCDCPLNYICSLYGWSLATNDSLFEILESFNCDDQEIYDLLKARLDKVVE